MKKSKLLMQCLGILVFFVLWELLALYFSSEIILPGPVATIKKLAALVLEKNFLEALGMSFGRVILSLLLSVPLGLFVGFFCALDSRIEAFFRPFFNFIAATPVMALILILFLWFGTGFTPVFTSFLMVFPVITANTMTAIQRINPQFLELFKAYGIKGMDKIRFLYIPEVLPYLHAALKSSLSLAWKVVVAAEVIVQPTFGLGTGMQNAKANLETTGLFAWTISTVIAASLCDLLLRFTRRRI